VPRPIRIQYPGAIYHLLSRGDRREAIFVDEGDRHDFLKTLAEACQKTRFEVHAYYLMNNHFHLVVETAEGRRAFERRMETRRTGEGDPNQWQGVRRGWCLGSGPFKAALLERLHGHLGPHHSGATRRQAGAARAEKIIGEELRRRRWRESDLSRRAKADPGKLALAARLRKETTLTITEIAQRLQMGSRKGISPKIHQWRKAHE